LAQASPPVGLGPTAGFSDPFFLYYGWYLPRQQLLANQPGPELMLNQVSAGRQINALTERAGLYDPIGNIGQEELDPMRPFGSRSGVSRHYRPSPTGLLSTNTNGAGPATYYNRTAGANGRNYFPSMRLGRGPNRNIVSTRSGGGRFGIPFGGIGLPGGFY
ncbi:MAG: hypothetical protein IRY99_24310, partial [Isosphaeraceae bacterium]|nr:hypothetical protein [Isosphaeraceae bacterium]